ncbi:MAG: response regulator [Chloroflexota bacterium]
MPDHSTKKAHILLVEDEIAHAELIRRAFETKEDQIALTVVHTLRDARAHTAATKPDLAIIDLLLPDGNGIEFLTHAEEELSYPVVIMTSHGDEQVAVEAIKAGALDYVVKSDVSLLEMPHIAERALREWSLSIQRQQAEARLRESEERFRQVISSISDHIYMTEITPQGTYINRYMSPNSAELTGYSQEQLLANWEFWPSLIHDDDREIAQLQFQRLTAGQNSEVEYRLTHADGRIIWVRDNARVKDEGDSRVIYGVVSNITERKQIEAELKQYREHLEELVVKRTAELKRATEAAQAASRAKSEFLSNMSHELRTPLNGILGYTQILRRDPNLTTRQKDALGIIQDSGHHLLTLINDILDLSKIEASRMELYPSPVHLPNFLRDIINIIAMRAQQKGITFHHEIDPGLPMGVLADEKRLRQVLINLLDNAVKFTDSGQVTFQVGRVSPTAYELEEGRNILRFEVSDTGIGIAASQLPRIFRPFEQVGDRRHRSEGTGLGLAISRKLVQMMGGDLHVTSEPGHGSMFWFTADLASVAYQDQLDNSLSQKIIGYKGARRRALVIDDKKHNLLVLGDMLESLGLEAVLAESGEEGLAKAHQITPDIILLDLVMPGMDGYETVTEIRQQPNLQHIPVVAVSASAFDKDKERSITAGCNEFLSKPLYVDALVRILDKYLQLEWQYQETAPATQLDPSMLALEPTAVSYTTPSAGDMSLLLDLALRGDMRGIRQKALELKEQNAGYTLFADTLTQLARQYDEQTILALIKQNM